MDANANGMLAHHSKNRNTPEKSYQRSNQRGKHEILSAMDRRNDRNVIPLGISGRYTNDAVFLIDVLLKWI